MSSPYFVLMGKLRPAFTVKNQIERKDVLQVITVVIACTAIMYGILYTANKYFIPIWKGEKIYTDYSVYYEAAQSFRNEANSTYRSSAPHQKGGSFNYPPFSLVLFYPLSFLAFPLSYTLFSVINTLCCVGVGWLTLKIMKEYSTYRIGFRKELFFLFLCVGLAPIVQNAKHAQINGIIALVSIAALYLALRKSYVTAMVLLSIGFGLKLYPILLAIPITALILFDKEEQNRFKITMYSILGFLGVQVLSLLMIPLSLYEYYFTEYIALLSNYTCLSGFNQSFSGIMMRLLTPDFNAGTWQIVEILPLFRTITLLLQICGISWVVFMIKRKNDLFFTFCLCALIMVSMPLLSPLGWEYVYVLCLPLLGVAYVLGNSEINRVPTITLFSSIAIVTFCVPKIGYDTLIDLQAKYPDFLFHIYYSRWFFMMIVLSIVVYRAIVADIKQKQYSTGS